jgi:hypothetical protein
VLAQNSPYSQVIINTQMAQGMSAPSVAPIITVNATAPSIAGVYGSNSGTVSYASSFNGDTRTVTFVPGSYDVSATAPGYYFTYSRDCTGFTPAGGAIRYCSIVVSTTPPPSTTNCTNGTYGNGTCVPPVVPYNGSTAPSTLSCSPSYQTVAEGQAVSFIASGGTPGGYNWTTPYHTSLNVGPNFTTTFQNTGVQTVMINNGVQSASCTVNVVLPGTAGITVNNPTTVVTSVNGSPQVVARYVPSSLPNTGFGPIDGAVLAFSMVLLIAAGIYAAPYVRQAIAITRG